jgi:DNA-binding MarR family transcriptional regulator
MRVHAQVVDHLESDLADANHLPLDWYELLVTLRLAGGALRMHELAEQLTLSRSAATRFVDRVEEVGLVERTICPTDRRGMMVALTETGRRAQQSAAPVTLRGIQRHFGQHLTEQQIEELATTLEAILRGEERTCDL